jgi:hypothetical protein
MRTRKIAKMMNIECECYGIKVIFDGRGISFNQYAYIHVPHNLGIVAITLSNPFYRPNDSFGN